MEPPHCALTFIVRLTLIRCRTLVLMLFMLATLHRTAWGDDIAWKNPVSGNWGTPSNWNPAQVPDAADNAIITVSGTYTVTLDVTATVTAVNLGGASGTQTLAIGANTLTLTGPSTVDTHGVLTMSGGVLSGGDALTVNGAFNWTGGTQSGTGTTTIGATGTLTIGGEVGLQRRVINNGTTVWSAGRVGVLNGTFINNNAFSAESDDNFDNFGGSNAFNNTGTFTKSPGAGTTAFNIPFNNSGTVNVNSGTLVLNAGGGGTGSFVLAPGKTLRFAGGTHELTAGAVMGAGVVQFSGGTVNLGATYDIGGSTTVNGGAVSFTGMVNDLGNPLTLNSGTLSGSSALTVNGAFNWTGGTQSGTGTTTIGATGTLTIGGEVGLQRRVINNGTTVWSAGRVGVLNGTFINNNAFSAESDDNFDNFGGSNAFNNTGTFTKSTGAGPTAFNIPFNNSGTVNVNSGTLVLNAGGGGTGSFVLAPGKTLRFAGGTHELTAGAVMGAGVVQFSGGTVNLGATYDIGGSTTVNGGAVSFTGMVNDLGNPLTLNSGTLSGSSALTVNGAFNWTGGTQSGTGTTTIGATGTLTIGGEVGLQRRVINNGTTVWSAGRVGVLNGTFINNNAFSAESDDNFDNFGGSNAFNNTGTFTKRPGAGTTAFNIPFNNSGTVNVNSGTLVLNAGGGGTGSFVLAPGKTLRFAGGTHELTAGAVMGAGVVQFSGGTVNLGATYDIGGRTTVDGGGVRFTGMVNDRGDPLTLSSGTLSGSSALAVTGAFNWTGGTQSGTGTTTIGATGTLTIGGEVGLQRRLINNGTTVWSAGRIGVLNGTFINNNAFSAESDDNFDNFGGSNAFNNTGTFTKSPGAGTTAFNIPFNNSGTVNVNSGTLVLNAGGGGTGSFVLAPGKTLRFAGGTHELTAG